MIITNGKKFNLPHALEIQYMFPWSSYDDLLTNNKSRTMLQRQKNVKKPENKFNGSCFLNEKEKVF